MRTKRQTSLCALAALSALVCIAAEASASDQAVLSGAQCIPISRGTGTLDPGAVYTYGSGISTGTYGISEWGLTNLNTGSLERLFCPLPDFHLSGPGSFCYNSIVATVYNLNSSNNFTCVAFTTDEQGVFVGSDTESVGFTGTTPGTLTFNQANYTGGEPMAFVMCDVPPRSSNYSWLTSITYNWSP